MAPFGLERVGEQANTARRGSNRMSGHGVPPPAPSCTGRGTSSQFHRGHVTRSPARWRPRRFAVAAFAAIRDARDGAHPTNGASKHDDVLVRFSAHRLLEKHETMSLEQVVLHLRVRVEVVGSGCC